MAAVTCIVDDVASVCDALAWLLRSRQLHSQQFSNAQAFEKALADLPLGKQPCCLLLDVRMPVTSGLALFDRLAQRALLAAMPVIFLTGMADVPTGVRMIKLGAFNFCEKLLPGPVLLDRIEQALGASGWFIEMQRSRSQLKDRLETLTHRERLVMRLAIEGLPNKSIADDLLISMRTVEAHRARIFAKMGVRSVVELANLLC